MEKFGIFELLDALSALTAPQNTPAPENTPPSMDDYLAPPAYAAPPKESAPPADPFAAFPPSEEKADAFSAFLARHDEAVSRIEKKR